MDEKWQIIYYETSQGKSPVFDFIQSLNVKAQNKIAVINRQFLLLHAFAKKKQKTDKREINTAIDRLNDYNSR